MLQIEIFGPWISLRNGNHRSENPNNNKNGNISRRLCKFQPWVILILIWELSLANISPHRQRIHTEWIGTGKWSKFQVEWENARNLDWNKVYLIDFSYKNLKKKMLFKQWSKEWFNWICFFFRTRSFLAVIKMFVLIFNLFQVTDSICAPLEIDQLFVQEKFHFIIGITNGR